MVGSQLQRSRTAEIEVTHVVGVTAAAGGQLVLAALLHPARTRAFRQTWLTARTAHVFQPHSVVSVRATVDVDAVPTHVCTVAVIALMDD